MVLLAIQLGNAFCVRRDEASASILAWIAAASSSSAISTLTTFALAPPWAILRPSASFIAVADSATGWLRSSHFLTSKLIDTT